MCTYVCTYICTVCMYVCTYILMYVRMYLHVFMNVLYVCYIYAQSDMTRLALCYEWVWYNYCIYLFCVPSTNPVSKI